MPLPLHPQAQTQWRQWQQELDAARGPKPLAVIERLFVSAYAPLRDALALGLADPAAEQVADAWGRSFEKSYTDAFEALRVRGKRPLMVLDLPDVALRLARLHGARATQLVLVDGLRFDLGQRVCDRLVVELGRRAALTERLLAWAALPATTATQLDLLARGPEGLREAPPPDSTLPVARGRTAALPRRVKLGRREVTKLDLVEARLAEEARLGPPELLTLAHDTAAALAAHFARIRERTLVVVFGDHGFVLRDGHPRERGAYPEEVLVPAHAWLVGDVH